MTRSAVGEVYRKRSSTKHDLEVAIGSSRSVSRLVSAVYVMQGTFALQSWGGSRRVRPGLDP